MAESASQEDKWDESKVLFVHRLPAGTTEQELMELCAPWKPAKALVLAARKQGFVEFEAQSAAKDCMLAFQTEAPKLKDHFLAFHNARREKIVEGGPPGHRSLLITMTNVKYPVYAETLKVFFTQRGLELKKVVIFDKPFGKQALVELDSEEAAEKAQRELDGKQLFTDGNFMRVQYSNFTSLKVTKRDELNRDYTEDPPEEQQEAKEAHKMLQQRPALSVIPLLKGCGMRPPPGFPFSPFFVLKPPSIGDTALQHLSTASAPFYPRRQSDTKSPVLLVNNLPEPTSPNEIFNLFGIYGNVTKVKIMMRKPDTALVQFQAPQQAQVAKTYLHNCVLQGATVKISPSKYPDIVIEPPVLQSSCQDFSSSKHHRYKTLESFNQKKVAYPGETLHVSNIALSCYETEEISELFAPVAKPIVVKFLTGGKDKKMALAKFASPDASAQVIMKFHNHRFMGRDLKLTFAVSALMK